MESYCCELCLKERLWQEEHPGSCYRCAHNMPCQIAQEDGAVCNTILDLIVDATRA